MDFGGLIEAGASSVLNELLASFRDPDGGMALPSSYEVLFLPPSGTRQHHQALLQIYLHKFYLGK